MESANRTMEDTVSKSDLDARSASYPIGQGSSDVLMNAYSIGQGSSDVLMNAFASPQQAITTDEGIHAYPSQQYASSSGDICDYAVARKQAMSGIDMNGHVFAAPFQPACSALPAGHVMTDEQLETLRRQIFVYATICQQLVEMHKAIMAQQGSGSGSWLGPSIPFDSSLHSMGHKLTSRQRWTPSQTQLHILEKLFEQESGTPNKQRIKEITLELSQHGQISETNVYNWFQNRRARTKRKQQLGGPSNGDSEFDTDADLPDEKKGKIEADFATYSFDAVPATSRVALGADNMEHQQGISNLPQRCGQLSNAAMAFFGTQGAYDES